MSIRSMRFAGCLCAIAIAITAFTGCSSFRTTVLQRFSDDSVAPQTTNTRLKGVPVKLKVPSHLLVTIYEEQVILANSDAVTQQLDNEAAQAATNLIEARNALRAVESAPAARREELAGYDRAIAKAETLLADEGDVTIQESIEKTIDALKKDRAGKLEEVIAADANLANTVALRDTVARLEAARDVAEQKAAVGYTLVSFSPAQLHVESELQYTDKVFLVDFKRPAGGVLDLKGAEMDDEQYFADVSADITERTMKDIGEALGTFGEAAAKLRPSAENRAIPVSAETPDAEASNTVNFQKSIVAMKRFDVNECDWEQRVQEFIEIHLGRGDLSGDRGMPAHQHPGAPAMDPEFESTIIEQSLPADAPVTAPSLTPAN